MMSKEVIKMMKKILKTISILCITLLLVGCGSENERKEDLLGIDFSKKSNEVSLKKYDTENPLVAMYIKNYGAIVMELYPDKAENTVNNFISLVKSGFYDNNSFHRLVPGFVLQGGDPDGTGMGGPDYSIKGEFSENGYTNNNLKHKKGIVSMARSQDKDSAGSQFFIMLDDSSNLDGSYAAFGKVIDGFDIIKLIEEEEIVDDATTGKLRTNLTLKKALVDTKGKEYKEVEKIEK